nr:MAG: replication initiator protein [Microvirus sp.]
MPCYSPINAGFDVNGKMTFSPKKHDEEYASFKIPCGRCVGCRLDRSRDWAVRCVHEAQIHDKSCFITLTYRNSKISLTDDGVPTLNHYDFQLFMKRLRKEFGDGIGFFMAGEYGGDTSRPHYHALLFGVDFDDKQYLKKNENGDNIYVSDQLDSLWGLNDPDVMRCEIGAVSFESAAYVARYVMKKLYGEMASLYDGRVPDYCKSSRKYAIGKRWLEKYWTDVFNVGSVVLKSGAKVAIPRYYVKWLEKNHYDAWLKHRFRDKSFMLSDEFQKDNTRERLRVKSIVKKAEIKTLRRSFDG